MTTLLLNTAGALGALGLVILLWLGIHLQAQKRFGERQLNCRGGAHSAQGEQVCCQDPSCGKRRTHPTNSHIAKDL